MKEELLHNKLESQGFSLLASGVLSTIYEDIILFEKRVKENNDIMAQCRLRRDAIAAYHSNVYADYKMLATHYDESVWLVINQAEAKCNELLKESEDSILMRVRPDLFKKEK